MTEELILVVERALIKAFEAKWGSLSEQPSGRA
jgi:hypothetical protein